MLKYILLIQELNNEVVDAENQTTFNMNDVVESARDGHTALLEQLHQATKICVCEQHVSSGKNSYGEGYVSRYCICTPKKGRKVIKEHIGSIVPTNDEMIANLVEYHNRYCEQTGMEKISLDELNALYQATQAKHTL